MSTATPMSVLLVACTQRKDDIPPRVSTAAAKPPIDTSRRKRKASRMFDFPAALGPTKNARDDRSTSAFLKFRQFCSRMCVKRMMILARCCTHNVVSRTISHPKNPKPHLRYRRIQGRRQRQPHHAPRLARHDDTVIPQPRRRVIGMPLALVLLQHRALERG